MPLPTNTITVSTPWITAEFRYTGNQVLSPYDGKVKEILVLASSMNDIVPLSFFSFEQNPQSNTYNYKIQTKDGRTWGQNMIFSPNDEPSMTFMTTGSWRMSEFERQRSIRELIISMKREDSIIFARIDWP